MRFALFGSDSAAQSVARAVAVLPGHQLTRVVGRPSSPPAWPPSGANLRYVPSWEELLPDSEVDAVIVSGEGDEKQNAVRQLVAAGKSVLLPPALTQPAPFFYELALLEAERPGGLFPLLGLRGHPLIVKLRRLIVKNEIGRLRHVRLERKMTPLAAGTLLTGAELAQALLGDADILRNLCGAYDQVTASRSGDAGQGYSLASVTLAGSAAPQAIWTAAATTGEMEWRLTLEGEGGTALLEGDPDRAWFRLTLTPRLILTPGAQTATSEEGDFDAGKWLVETFAASAANGRQRDADSPSATEAASGISLWDELARSVELVEAVERSVRRRRTIDVYFETPSERGLFKTQMTAIGCSLLFLTPAAIVVYLALAASVEIPPVIKKVLVALLFLPLGLFLALQLLLFVSRPATRDGR